MSIDILKLDYFFKKILEYSVIDQRERIFCSDNATQWYMNMAALSDRISDICLKERIYDYDFYILETEPILGSYVCELNIPVKRVFGKRYIRSDKSKKKLVDLYMNVVSRLRISDVYPRRFDGAQMSEVIEEPPCTCDDIECEGCVENREYSIKTTYNDTKRASVSHRTTNEKRSHFLNCFNQHMGVQKVSLPPDLLNKIEASLYKYDLINTETQVREERFARVTKEHVKLILKDLNLYKNYNENLTLIFKQITGDPCPDVNCIKEKVMRDFDIFSDLYDRKCPADKKPFKYQQLLFQFLRRHGYACECYDFKFLKTTERKIYHEEIYKSLFAELGWNYTSMF